MKTILTKAGLAITLAATTLTVAAPADAQRYRRYNRGNDVATGAIIGGVVGLGLGAAIASSNRRDRYYDRGYYNGGGYYNDGYVYDRRDLRRERRQLRRERRFLRNQGYYAPRGYYNYNRGYAPGYYNRGYAPDYYGY